MSVDLNQTTKDIKGRLSALGEYKNSSESEKNILDKAGDNLTEIGDFASTQLNKIAAQQKSFQRHVPTSIERLLEMLQITQGSGPESLKFLRRRFLEAVVKIQPKIIEILRQESLSAIGCSEEQTYDAISPKTLQIQPISTLPVSQGTYIPVKSIDFMENLKTPVASWYGKIYYEKEDPSNLDTFVPFGGKLTYPINKMLRFQTLRPDETYKQSYGKFYNGKSQQFLFDTYYTTTNDLGVTGDYFRVFLLDRQDSPQQPIPNSTSGITLNKVGTFLNDYYGTVKVFDNVNFMASLVNLVTGAVDIRAQVGFGQLEANNRFYLILQRILGLCFDNREEIDVSGTAKIGELDGVDESFFELNEVDLRTIQQTITNIQSGVVEFVECDNVKLPVNATELTDELVNFREGSSGKTTDELVTDMENILDSISENQEWKLLVPNSVNLKVAIDRDIVKKIPLAVAATVFTPKVLLPIFVMLSEVERSAKNKINTLITSANTAIVTANTALQSGSTVGQNVNNIVNDGEDFIKKFTKFVLQIVSKVGAVFIQTLFEILKRDILILTRLIIKDIAKGKITKKYAIVLKLLELAAIVVQFVKDYRKCKSLLDDIVALLDSINAINFRAGLSGIGEIPLPLLLLSDFLPGFSPQRALLGTIENLQKLGIPTGPMPDGSPNLMMLFAKSIIQGVDTEESLNGKVEIVLDPKLPIRGKGKKL